VVTIVDAGLGMAPAELEAANRRLSGAESFTVAPSTYLGHYVAGRLAALHGMRVRLDSGRGRGLAATVTIPPTALVGHQPGVGAAGGPAAEAGWLPRSAYVPADALGEAGP
jgi:signal transduction histidine kinase